MRTPSSTRRSRDLPELLEPATCSSSTSRRRSRRRSTRRRRRIAVRAARLDAGSGARPGLARRRAAQRRTAHVRPGRLAGERLALPGGAPGDAGRARMRSGHAAVLAQFDRLGGRTLEEYLARPRRADPLRLRRREPWPLEATRTSSPRSPAAPRCRAPGGPFTPALDHARSWRAGCWSRRSRCTPACPRRSAHEPPFPECYRRAGGDRAARDAVARAAGASIAVGTTVVRALETVTAPDGGRRTARGLDRARDHPRARGRGASTAWSRAGTSPRPPTCRCSRRSPAASCSSAATTRRSATATCGTSSATAT